MNLSWNALLPLAIAGLLAVSAASTADEVLGENGLADESVRHMFLIATGTASSNPDEVAMAPDAGATASETVSFDMGRPLISCCGGSYDSVQTTAFYSGDDFLLDETRAIEGQLHLTWEYFENFGGWPLSSGQAQVHVYATLEAVGCGSFSSEVAVLQSDRGDQVFPVAFGYGPTYDENGTIAGPGGLCPEGNHTYAHDMSLNLEFEVYWGYSYTGDLLGESFHVELDTAGGSFFHLTHGTHCEPAAAMDEAVEETALEAPANETPLEGGNETGSEGGASSSAEGGEGGEGGNSTQSAQTFEALPGASFGPMMAAVLGILYVVNRRRPLA